VKRLYLKTILKEEYIEIVRAVDGNNHCKCGNIKQYNKLKIDNMLFSDRREISGSIFIFKFMINEILDIANRDIIF